ncbi:MAG: right-handed parallel beta-helix repeat-containing protein [candidate division KSB1 bacterium]|nr:right-handed parallel beta-helix repeat-containing protein [candidate division KSB1 bacterium]MDZ7273628.1 right-handed parallel beta-helix repeat-containing protein [candidate division KSB1 bacterium]MDZ7286781.1 right-handed parallel beta-helix repeat-containing protein [candidate division KSB1 bacterium]MDZ7299862.1 right-handed parallel beta-helix repeat-containing protein [candidate division KSB1 bacterium]MDZ7305799.1 right-handed parallel beta-helix repeat-containing protein [candidat
MFRKNKKFFHRRAQAGVLLAGLLALLVPNSLWPATRIVKPGESITAKLAGMQPGDTLLVRGGIYNEAISLPVSGTAGRRIVLRGYPGEKPVIAATGTMLNAGKSHWLISDLVFDHQGDASDAIKISGSFLTLRNCELRNGKRDGIEGAAGSSEVTIENCVIRDFVWQAGSDAHGIVLNPGARRWRILNNTIFNCGGDGIQLYADDKTEIANYATDITISGNIFYTTLGSNSENALDFKGVDGCVVEGNEMYGFENKAWVTQKGCRNITGRNNFIHDSQRGIEFRGEGGKSQANIRLLRNVLYNIRQYYAIKFDDVANVEILHNTLANISASSFRIEGKGVSNAVVRNNLIHQSGAVAVAGPFAGQVDHNGWFNAAAKDWQGSGDVTGSDPLFKNAAQGNFELQTTSPARDAGIDVGLPYVGANPDLGAFELGATTPVVLLAFSVAPAAAGARLHWRTSAEHNLLGFEVERRTGDGSFSKLAFIAAAPEGATSGEYEYLDTTAGSGEYTYRLVQIDRDGQARHSAEVMIALGPPAGFALHQNFPNPFSAAGGAGGNQTGTRIAFDLREAAEVNIVIFNLLGQKVKTLTDTLTPAGRHVLMWDGRGSSGEALAAGTYLCRMRVSQRGVVTWTDVRRMTLVQ